MFILASDPLPWLAPWGQAAAIVILLYLLVVVLIGLVLAAVLMFGLSWVREKVELIKKLRPTVESVNTTTELALEGKPLPANENKVIKTVAEVPVKMHDIERKVDQGSDKVAKAVIEFRARTEMAKAMVKTFFLPKLAKEEYTPTELEKEGIGFRSPGYRMLVEERAPEGPTGVGDGYLGNPTASQLKQAPVQVPTSAPAKDEAR